MSLVLVLKWVVIYNSFLSSKAMGLISEVVVSNLFYRCMTIVRRYRGVKLYVTPTVTILTDNTFSLFPSVI